MYRYAILAIVSIALSGCGSKDNLPEYLSKDPGVYVGSETKTMAELGEGDVFLIVNGRQFSKADYLKDVSVYDKMLRMGHKTPLTGFNSKAAEALEKMAPSIVTGIMRRELMAQLAKKNTVEPDAKYVNEVSFNVLKSINRGHASLDSVCKEMGGETGERFRNFVESEALDMTLRDLFDKDGILKIKEDDVISYSNRFEKSIAEAAEKNAHQRDLLAKALQEIGSGADFVDVAVKYSDAKDAKEEAKYWDEYAKEDFEGEEVLENWAMSAKDGDVSGVLELDDGYAIVKLLRKRDEILDPDDDSIKETVWEFAKIHRDMFEPLPELTHDDIVDAYRKERSVKIQKIIGDTIMETAVIEWPYGTNLFENVKN